MDAAEWTGRVGSAWAEEWSRTDRSFAGLAPALDAAIRSAIDPGTVRVVDIGCGAGTTSIALASDRPDLSITGIDISPDLIATARRRGAGHPGLSFIAGPVEARIASFAPVDLFMSRHGVMFFPDPVAAFAALRAAAAPHARLVFSCFRAADENPWAGALIAAINGAPAPVPTDYVPGPFAFADPAFVADILTRAGWRAPPPTPVDFRYQAGGGADPVDDALSFFARIGPVARMLNTADSPAKAHLRDKLRQALAAHQHGDSVDFPGAAWLWSAQAA